MARDYVSRRYHLFDQVTLSSHALDVSALLLSLILKLLDYVLHVVDLGRLVHDLLAGLINNILLALQLVLEVSLLLQYDIVDLVLLLDQLHVLIGRLGRLVSSALPDGVGCD